MKTEELKKLIESKVESVKMRENALKWAKENQGKAIRSNNLPEGFAHLRRQYGMTHIETESYQRDKTMTDKDRCSLLIDWAEKLVVVPTPEVLIERNPAYYRGVDERNESRRKLLSLPALMAEYAAAVTRLQEAVAEYREAKSHLKAQIGYMPEQYDLEKIAGVIEEKRQ